MQFTTVILSILSRYLAVTERERESCPKWTWMLLNMSLIVLSNIHLKKILKKFNLSNVLYVTWFVYYKVKVDEDLKNLIISKVIADLAFCTMVRIWKKAFFHSLRFCIGTKSIMIPRKFYIGYKTQKIIFLPKFCTRYKIRDLPVCIWNVYFIINFIANQKNFAVIYHRKKLKISP